MDGKWLPHLKASPAASYFLARLLSTPSATWTSAFPAPCRQQAEASVRPRVPLSYTLPRPSCNQIRADSKSY